MANWYTHTHARTHIQDFCLSVTDLKADEKMVLAGIPDMEGLENMHATFNANMLMEK